MKTPQKEFKKLFCQKCGHIMNVRLGSADELDEFDVLPDRVRLRCYPKFNRETGEENLVQVYECPLRKIQYTVWFGKVKTKVNKNHCRYAIKHNF